MTSRRHDGDSHSPAHTGRANTFTPEELGAHAGLALKLILGGMDVLTGTTLDVARVIGT